MMRVEELIEQLQKTDPKRYVYLNTGADESKSESCRGVAIDTDGDVVVVSSDMEAFYCGGCQVVGHFHDPCVEGG